MADRDSVERKVDRIIDRYADDIGYSEMELLLQHRAQDMRELATDAEESPADLELEARDE